MRRSSEVLGGRSRKDLESSGLLRPIPLGHNNSPISFRMARGDELEDDSRKEENGTANNSVFGVHSIQKTIYDPPCLQENRAEGDDHEGDAHEGDAHGGRRRSTLKPVAQHRTRDSSLENIESTTDTADSSPSRPAQEGPSPPSMSHSLTSLSLDSQAPLSSLPSTPKSISNPSFRHSDEESMDDGASQAIVSSEDEVELQSEIQDSAPQLIMPSIKMPSRRPFTERGKAMGRLKVLIAGDSGMRTILDIMA